MWASKLVLSQTTFQCRPHPNSNIWRINQTEIRILMLCCTSNACATFISAWTLHDNRKDGLSMSHASLLWPDRISKGVQCSTCTKTQQNIPRAAHILQLYTPIRLSCQQLHTLKGLAFNRLLRFVVRWWNAERCVLPTQSLSLSL